jgi:putative transcriptional regulator
MKPEYPDSLKGHFIVAMPSLMDPNFSYTVTCICEHNAHGAMGIVVNRLHEVINGQTIFDELKIPCSRQASLQPVHIGGPVHLGELFILHGPPFDWEACLRVTPNVGLSNSRDILEAIGRDRGPGSFLVSLGCAGWGPGQLEAEILENAWLTHPVFEENLFSMPVDKRWETAVRKIGIDPKLLTGVAGHA